MRRFTSILLLLVVAWPVFAAEPVFDSDGDGLSDAMEANIYYTDSLSKDTDGDGYDDKIELDNGYNPLGSGRLYEVDTDGDGLDDADELLFGTSLAIADTDADGFEDGLEIAYGYDPTDSRPVKLRKWIDVALDDQKLSYNLGPKTLGVFTVSTGKPGYETPIGTYHVNDKIDRAWSASAKLWMPYWMPFIGGLYGIHELPEWPNGAKEGEAHLGTPVSHGCIRLGVGAAEELYRWADIGTEVVIHQ